MPKISLSFKKPVADRIKMIARQADALGYRAYLVGGPVRDILLHKKMGDVDIVVEGDLQAVLRRISRTYAEVKQYKDFGTASLHFPRVGRIDLATARKEIYPRPGALPVVSSGSIQDDLLRRDFTINAMAVSISQKNAGEFFDFFQGQRDLEARRIRVLHEKSFQDDPTRTLRAVRFEQRFGFKIEKKTLSAFKQAVDQGCLTTIKSSRYLAELKKMMLEERPAAVLKRAHQLGLLSLMGLKGKYHAAVVSIIERNSRAFDWARFPDLSASRWIIYLLALIEGSSMEEIHRILEHFPFTREEKATLQQSTQYGKVFKRLSQSRLRRSEVYRMLMPLTSASLVYLRVRINGKTAQTRLDQFLLIDRHLRLKVSGEDLCRIGYEKSVALGKVLKELLELKLDQELLTKNDELRMARRLIPHKDK